VILGIDNHRHVLVHLGRPALVGQSLACPFWKLAKNTQTQSKVIGNGGEQLIDRQLAGAPESDRSSSDS